MRSQNIWDLTGRERHKQIRRIQVSRILLDPQEGDAILDIGCGEGFFGSQVGGPTRLYVGLDTEPESLLDAKSRIKSSESFFVVSTIRNIPFPPNSFDKIACLEVLEHLSEKTLRQGVAEIKRVLKPGGSLIVSVPYREVIVSTRCIHCSEITPLYGHLRSMDERTVSELLTSSFRFIEKNHLPNIAQISIMTFFERLHPKVWLMLNRLLGTVRKGYWILLKYEMN